MEISSLKKIFPSLIIISATTLPCELYAKIQTIQGAPLGFEELEKPRPTVIAVFYGGELIGSFHAQASPFTVQFDEPNKIIKSISSLIQIDQVKTILSKPLPNNLELVCTNKSNENCGILNPKIIGIIFNESRLTAELFINKNYLSIVSNNESRYLPLPEEKFGSVYALNGAVTGSNSDTANYSFNNNAIFSLGPARLAMQANLSNPGLRFDNANASLEKNGWNSTVGLFRSFPAQLIGDQSLLGISLTTSQLTVLDKYKSEGNKIILYLPRRSFVSIYRDQQLYSSRSYEAGNQEIDTGQLPEGSYNIRLQIQESDGTTRQEQRFFTKTPELPSLGHPNYYAQLGQIRKTEFDDELVPEFTNEFLLRLGSQFRLNNNFGLNIGLLGFSDRAMTESGIFWISKANRFSFSGLTSTEDDWGWQASYLRSQERLNAAIDVRKLWMNNVPLPGYSDLTDFITQASATISFAVRSDITLGGRVSFSEQTFSLKTTSIGPYFDWRIWQSGETILSLNASFAEVNEFTENSVLLYFSHGFGPSYGVSGMASTTSTLGMGQDTNAGVKAWGRKQDVSDEILMSAGLNHDKNGPSISGDTSWSNRIGYMQGAVQQAYGEDFDTLNYASNFGLNIAQHDKKTYIGGSESAQSAVIVDVEGDADHVMNIFVNNTEYSQVKVGRNQVIYLQPFNTYRIRIAPQKSGLLDYESSDKKVTLYPGNVAKLKWEINNFYVFVGKIVDKYGKALKYAMLQESKTPINTDENGNLQAQISQSDRLTFTLKNNKTCQVDLPDNHPTINGVLLFKDSLVCKPVIQLAVP
ncbi:MAG: TcfC E-set like domain-containing protein [Pseudomonadota bacterium]